MSPKERQPPSNHDIELAPQASCWTPERLELKTWLTRNAPSLAELYEGAICLLFEHRLPGYTRFVTHAAREIANRLPDAISAAGSAGKLQYSERLDQITEQWKKANPGGGNPFQSSETAVSSPGATPLEVAIPLDLFRLLENLIADHEAASEKVADAFRRMLIGRKTENQNFIPTLQPVVSQWRLVTRWFVSKAHDSGRVDADIDNTELLKKFELFERTLLAIIQQFFATTDALEQILKEANSSCAIPTSEQVERAIACIVHSEHNRYFFDRLENPQWLVPLEKKGFFKAPPAPIHDEPRGTIAFPIWPQSRYLARMTKVAPEAVAEIMTRIPETENIRVHDDFASAALALPPKLAARIIPNAKSWIKSPFKLLLPEKLGALISHLARGGELEASLALAKSLLAVRPESGPLFHLWNYEHILQRNIPDLVAAAGFKALQVLCVILEAAVRLSREADGAHTPDDYSYIWRPTIEHPRHTVDDLLGVLVSAVRDAAEQLCRQDPETVPQIVRYLESRAWRVFHRIALHLLRLFAGGAPDLVSERLREPERFDRMDFHREYSLLAKQCFNTLSPGDQAKILDWIQKGPNIEALKAGWERLHGARLTDEQAASYVKAWQRDRLVPINADLPAEWHARYTQLVLEVGPAENPEDAVVSMSPYWGPTSPKGAEDLSAMSIDELLTFLRSWLPPPDPLGASIAGLGNALSTLVAAKPEQFSSAAERFKCLDPTYVRSLLRGLWEAVRQKRAIDWEKALALSRWVVDQPREILGRTGGLVDQDPDWGRTRKAIADLLASGFESDAVPFEFRHQAWAVLEPLTADPDPTPEDESQSSPDYDPANYSINTIRGEAMHGVVGYARWTRRGIEKQPDASIRAASGFDQMPEARAVLDRHLDPHHEPSCAIRTVYGQWFPWLHFLDPSWAKESVPKIFPDDEAFKDLRDAAWKAYVVYCTPSDEMFELLHAEYGKAIDRIGACPEQKPERRRQDKRLAEHLVTLYLRGYLDLDDLNGLLARFFAKADLELRKSVIATIGISLQNASDPVVPEIVERLQKLWLRRLDTVRTAGLEPSQTEEIRDFGWWFGSKKLPDLWGIEQVFEVLKIAGSIEPDHLVVERLAELAVSMPAKAVDCLAMIVEGDKDGWAVLSWRDQARALLAAALHSADQTAHTRAVELINDFGRRGYPEFRDLLPANVMG